eukprot:m.243703 g.243703  ORF g.243703 m.243703 type:complete len:138 (+) comp46333_c0_seq1:38-451(+)
MGAIRTFVVICFSLVFLMAGSVKLYPFDDTVHGMMENNFKRFHNLWSGDQFGVTDIDFRLAVGGIEVICALLLWVFPKFASLVLMCVMIGAVYTHILGDDTPGEIAVPAVLGLIAFLLLIVPSANNKGKSGKNKKDD